MFYAWDNANGYTEVPKGATVYPETWLVEGYTWPHYFMRSNGSGVWCFDVGNYGEYQMKCVGGMTTYSKRLETGSEAATESFPDTAAAVVTNASWGGSIHQWNFAYNSLSNETGRVSYNGMCVEKFSPWGWPGNIWYGTSGMCPGPIPTGY